MKDIHERHIVRTLVIPRHGGPLRVSSDRWISAPDGYEANPHKFSALTDPDALATLREYFGSFIPEYPGEWCDTATVGREAERPPTIERLC